MIGKVLATAKSWEEKRGRLVRIATAYRERAAQLEKLDASVRRFLRLFQAGSALSRSARAKLLAFCSAPSLVSRSGLSRRPLHHRWLESIRRGARRRSFCGRP